MTTIYDPTHAAYVDEADTRGELTRVFNVCDECRRCVSLCSTFPSIFDTIDGHAVQHDDRDAGRLTPEQQDRVVGQCFQCKLCAVDCPYAPGRHERQIDLPRLMLRAEAMRRANGHHAASRRSTRGLINTGLVNTGLARTVATSFTSPVNRVTGARAGSRGRRMLSWLTGVSAVRRLPTLATQRFSSWFRHRDVHAHRVDARSRRPVAVYSTCLVEFHLPAIGRDLVQVYERNGIDCTLSQARCCGAPLLHAGNVKKFSKVASVNVKRLANEVRGGRFIVVPEPMCSHVVRHDYPMYVQSSDAALVAQNTFDGCEYLMQVQVGGESGLDTEFVGPVPTAVTYCAASHLRVQGSGQSTTDLLRLTGAIVRTVGADMGDTGWWGLRSGHEDIASSTAERLAQAIVAADETGVTTVVSDSVFASLEIAAQTGTLPLHPLQVVARAYGIAGDQPLDEA